jgi:hypothetical protein
VLRELFLLLAACAVAVLLGTWLQQPGQHVALGPGDTRALVGFYEREESPTGPFRWARPGAALFMYGFDGRPAIVALRLNAARPADADARIELRAGGGNAAGAFTVGSTWRKYLVLAPTNPTNDTPLWFGGESWRPAGDERDLVAALSGARAVPAETGLGPPFERTVFLLSFPLLAWLLVPPTIRSDRLEKHSERAWPSLSLSQARPRKLALAAGLVFVPLVAWAVARPAAAGYWLPTFGWPWWPLVPLALILGAKCNAQRAKCKETLHFARRTLHVPLKREGILLAAISLFAFALRLFELDVLPLGLWRDEARHGLLALQIWNDPGFRPVYVVEGADLPALLFYLMAPVLGTLGPGVASVRLVSAVAGALVPLALWWAARPLVGPRAAVLGAALLAWSSWALSMSRWGFPATLDQLLTLAAIGVALRNAEGRTPNAEQAANPRAMSNQSAVASQPWFHLGAGAASSGTPFGVQRSAFSLLSGVLAALAAYAYHTGRLAPLVLAILVAVALGADRAAWRRAAPGLAAAALAGLVVLAPLLWFVATDFAGYNRRTGAVAFYTNEDANVHAPLLLLMRNAQRYLLMWHVAGDANARHHAPGAPMVDVVTGGLLLLGLIVALAARHNKPMQLLLVWLALGMLPGLLSTGAPHAMRGLPALAPACALAGLGMVMGMQSAKGTVQKAKGNVQRFLTLSTFHFALSVLLLSTSMALNLQLYFVQMPRDPRVQEAFDVPETMMGRVVRTQQTAPDPALRAVRVFLPSAARRSEVVQLFAGDTPPGFFDPSTGLSAPPGEQALVLLPAGASSDMRAAAAAALGPGAHELPAPRYPDGRPVLAVYGVGEHAAALLRATFPP